MLKAREAGMEKGTDIAHLRKRKKERQEWRRGQTLRTCVKDRRRGRNGEGDRHCAPA
jgi:hypothetical protein